MAQAYTHKPCLCFSCVKIMNSGDNPSPDVEDQPAKVGLRIANLLTLRECTIHYSQATKQEKTVSFHIGFAMVWWLTVFAGADSVSLGDSPDSCELVTDIYCIFFVCL